MNLIEDMRCLEKYVEKYLSNVFFILLVLRMVFTKGTDTNLRM